MRVAGVLSGRRHPGSSLLHFETVAVDIYDCKGIAEAILQEVRLSRGVTAISGNEASTSPGYILPNSCIIFQAQDKVLGVLGKIDTGVLKSFGIKQDVFFFDLDFDMIAESQPEPKSFRQLPKFPSVNRDIALVVSESVAAGALLSAIDNGAEKLLESVEIFDVYRGESIGAGNKSVAITLTYRSAKQTLDDNTVNKVHQRLIKMLEKDFQAKLREAV